MNDVLCRIYEELDKRKISPSDMCKELKIANSTFFTWKTKDKIPPTESLIAISDYLGTSIDYLVSGTETSNESIESLGIYASFAKEAKDEGIDPEDIKNAIELIKSLRSK